MTDREAFIELMQRFGVPVEQLDLGDSGSSVQLVFDGNARGPVRRCGIDDVSFAFTADGAFEWVEIP